MDIKEYFGSIGMALSCTLFLEGALKKYKKYTVSVDDSMLKLIKEWNSVLLSLLRDTRYKSMIGEFGTNFMKCMSYHPDFALRCVTDGHDISVQSLHYALRFQENVKYLDKKIASCGSDNLSFCDLGSGLSPLSVVFQEKYNLSNVYCIDIVPEIADLYTDASYKLTGKIPEFITWNVAQEKAGSNGINTIVSVGCLPHMSLDVQKKYLKAINKKFDNFFLEIKYKKQEDVSGAQNAFDSFELQKLRIGVENVTNIETAMIQNYLGYMRRFVHAKPDRKDFLLNQSRSLFLSR